MVLGLLMTTSNKNDDSKIIDLLIGRIASGDYDALAQLYEYTSQDVYSFALSILKDAHNAQDVLQDCYIKIYLSANSYQSKGKPMAWILTITRNLCLKLLRSNSKMESLSEDEWKIIPHQESNISIENQIVLEQCMNILNDIERQIVVLHAVSGLKHREIASLLKIPLPTVLSKYHRSIQKLKKALEKGE